MCVCVCVYVCVCVRVVGCVVWRLKDITGKSNREER